MLPDESHSMLIATTPGHGGPGRRLKVDWKRADLTSSGCRCLAGGAVSSGSLLSGCASFGLVRRPFSIERIPGGLSNHNFAVRTSGESYFVRICQELPLLGIDRRNEMVCHEAASLRGLAPRSFITSADCWSRDSSKVAR